MFSIISGILGFATSGLTSLLGFFQQKGDHEGRRAKYRFDGCSALLGKRIILPAEDVFPATAADGIVKTAHRDIHFSDIWNALNQRGSSAASTGIQAEDHYCCSICLQGLLGSDDHAVEGAEA